MRRLFALLAVVAALQVSAGCRHVAGVCDCGEYPGEGVIHAPIPHPLPGTPAGPIGPAAPAPEVIPAPKEAGTGL